MDAHKREISAVPTPVLEAVDSISHILGEINTPFFELLTLCDPDVLAVLSPLERAQCLFLLSRAISAIFTLKLRCTGVDPDGHSMKTEIERLNVYGDKLERFIDWSTTPLRPSATLDTRAAARFIQHSLPDLTPHQKKGMKDISLGKGRMIKYVEVSRKKKRKCRDSWKPSVGNAAKEFLEKAARELVSDFGNEFKGPLQPKSSDSEDGN